MGSVRCLYLFLLVARVDILYKYCTCPNVFSKKTCAQVHPGHPASEYNTFYNLDLLVDIFIHPVQLYYIMINDNLVI